MKLIANWIELAKVPDSKTHRLEITPEDGNGWIVPKAPKDGYLDGRVYLSTHTFYGKKSEYSTRLLQDCGFDVELKSWVN